MIATTKTSEILTLNVYAYVSGNPVNRIDPFGLTECDVDAAYQTAKEALPNLNFGAGRPKMDLPNTSPVPVEYRFYDKPRWQTLIPVKMSPRLLPKPVPSQQRELANGELQSLTSAFKLKDQVIGAYL